VLEQAAIVPKDGQVQKIPLVFSKLVLLPVKTTTKAERTRPEMPCVLEQVIVVYCLAGAPQTKLFEN
jgi:hypothetical protein